MEFREATRADLKVVNDIRAKAGSDNGSLEIATQLEDVRYLVEEDRAITFITYQDNRPVGYISLNTVYNYPFSECEGVVFRVQVVPDMQGNKIGTKLIKLVEDYAANSTSATYIQLGVSIKNPRAMNLYQSLGYQVIGESWTGYVLRKDVER